MMMSLALLLLLLLLSSVTNVIGQQRHEQQQQQQQQQQLRNHFHHPVSPLSFPVSSSSVPNVNEVNVEEKGQQQVNVDEASVISANELLLLAPRQNHHNHHHHQHQQQHQHKRHGRLYEQQHQLEQRHLDDSTNCNMKNQLINTCQSFESFIESVYGSLTKTSFTNRVYIPCGICVTIDQSMNKTYTFLDGIDIQGQLIVDCHFTLKPKLLQIYTTLLLIQGLMKLDASCQVPVEDDPLIKIIMISKSDNSTSTYIPLDDTIATTCPNSVCNVGEKSITITGYGQINWIGLSSSTPSWVKLYNVTYDNSISITDPIGIVVPKSVQDRWAVGSLLLLSSFTTHWNQYQQLRLITGIKIYASNPNYVEITLNQTIVRPITQVDNNQYDNPSSYDTSVEVMLLSKNIVLTTSEVITKNKTIVGGHLWFYFTNSYQNVYGVDIQYFGQQGILGKYPLHFHFAITNELNLLAKNTIRYSLQRCIVIHGTNNVTISDNVAYDTNGHCFMTEDGIETNNKFINNIGILTKIPTYVIPPNAIMMNGRETDDRPSTFWISNPTNHLINNVAGGSSHSGFWYQPEKRGIRATYYPNIDPVTDPIGTFFNNVAHSNAQIGIRFYPFYNPVTLALFNNMKVYRNNVGVLFHVSSNLQMNNSYFSDNAAALDLEKTISPPILFNNITLVGESNSFRIIVRDNNLDNVCNSQLNLSSYSVGIDMGTWKQFPGSTRSIWQNIQFYNFNHASCTYISPISLYKYPGGTTMFDSYSTMKNLVFNDKGINKIDFCRAENNTVENIYMTDLDGSIKPDNLSSKVTATTNVASIISLQQSMMQFVNVGKCIQVSSKCYSYCQDTCFRGILYEVDPTSSLNMILKICSNANTKICITVPGYRRFIKDQSDATHNRYFPAYLPIGQYNAVFVDEDGMESWPTFANQLITDTTCPLTGTHTITMKVPQVTSQQCIQLIRNGNAEASNTEPLYWLKQGGGLQVLPGGGVDGTNAFASLNDTTTTLIQYLDTRCLNLMKNAVYNISADIKLLRDDGSIYICDPTKEQCPTIAVFGIDNGLTPNDDDANDGYAMVQGSYNQNAEIATASLSSDGFQTISGTVRLWDDLIKKDSVRLTIQSFQYRLIVDNISMKLANGTDYLQIPSNRTSCLSSSTLIEVRNTGYVPISHVQIGDSIRAGNGRDYTQVYGFGHLDHNMESEFIQIYLVDERDPVLEISPNHLLFVQRLVNNTSTEIMIPAADMMISDILNSKRVLAIHQITRRGVYAPLTESGDFQVNGIRVSNYVQILQNPYNMVWDQHLLGHACFMPQRLFCKYFMNVCQRESYINGYGITASMLVHVGCVINQQGWFVNMIAFIFILLVIGISFVMEILFTIDLAWWLVAIIVTIAMKCLS